MLARIRPSDFLDPPRTRRLTCDPSFVRWYGRLNSSTGLLMVRESNWIQLPQFSTAFLAEQLLGSTRGSAMRVVFVNSCATPVVCAHIQSALPAEPSLWSLWALLSVFF